MSKNVQSDIRAKANISAESLQWSMLGSIIWSSHINDEIMILRVTVIPLKMQCQIFITVTVRGIIILPGKEFLFSAPFCVLSSKDNSLVLFLITNNTKECYFPWNAIEEKGVLARENKSWDKKNELHISSLFVKVKLKPSALSTLQQTCSFFCSAILYFFALLTIGDADIPFLSHQSPVNAVYQTNIKVINES